MSGGSMDYLCFKVENDSNFKLNSPERIAFKKHLNLVAKALHDIEWTDSGDTAPNSENEAILKCITNSPVLDLLIDEAILARDQLDSKLKEILNDR